MYCYFIRHGESHSNAGGRSDSNADVPLSPRGHEQARSLAAQITRTPDLIVVSPFLRARQTAQPCIEKYPAAPVETWPVQEFCYLDEALCRDTNIDERAPLRDAYYSRNDPALVNGPGTESLDQLFERVETTLGRIDRRKFTLVFTHGLFIRALFMHLHNLPRTPQTLLYQTPDIENTQIFPL
ncbi:MAG: histidine phosphatase family protein [Candidatus Accumulibacter sp.]|jgi:broad specificity phosphatase PhoE|nr:histidine phosphatase family protein [Accumulibacter sp.]